MSAFSNYTENLVMNNLLGQASMTAIPNVHVALFTAGPTDAGGGTEVSGTGYARVALTNNTTNFPTTTTGLKQNAVAITFPTAGASWGTVSHYGIFDAASSGNLLFHGALTTAKAVASGDTPSIAINGLSIQLD